MMSLVWVFSVLTTVSVAVWAEAGWAPSSLVALQSSHVGVDRSGEGDPASSTREGRPYGSASEWEQTIPLEGLGVSGWRVNRVGPPLANVPTAEGSNYHTQTGAGMQTRTATFPSIADAAMSEEADLEVKEEEKKSEQGAVVVGETAVTMPPAARAAMIILMILTVSLLLVPIFVDIAANRARNNLDRAFEEFQELSAGLVGQQRRIIQTIQRARNTRPGGGGGASSAYNPQAPVAIDELRTMANAQGFELLSEEDIFKMATQASLAEQHKAGALVGQHTASVSSSHQGGHLLVPSGSQYRVGRDIFIPSPDEAPWHPALYPSLHGLDGFQGGVQSVNSQGPSAVAGAPSLGTINRPHPPAADPRGFSWGV